MAGSIHVGIGGWTYEPWRGTFYPPDLPQKRELEYASRRLTSIEINGTFYSTFKPASWAKWRDETPEGFVFAVKGSRYCTNRKRLAEAGESVERFVGQGLAELGDRLGPINWQLSATKRFDPDDVDAFLALLPPRVDGVALRHALEVRHPSFRDERFVEIARRHGVAIVFADHDQHPRLEAPTADFTYARLMRTSEAVETGYPAAELDGWAERATGWADAATCSSTSSRARRSAPPRRRNTSSRGWTAAHPPDGGGALEQVAHSSYSSPRHTLTRAQTAHQRIRSEPH